MNKRVVATAPSSSMLFGEHAVLRGKTACVAAIDRYLTVQLQSRDDDLVYVKSLLATSATNIRNIDLPHELRFVQKCLEEFQSMLTSGLDIEISSDIPHTVGLGSSASVTVAMIAALMALTQSHRVSDRKEVLRTSLKVIQSVQGKGSGADAASIVYGGIIAYRMQDLFVQKLASNLPLSLFYCGYKTPTSQVIEIINQAEKRDLELYHYLFDAIEYTTLRAISLIQEGNLKEIGFYMNTAHGLMESLGVSTKELSSLVWSARALPQVFGAKISGSGLGDSIVVLGQIDQPERAFEANGGVYVPGKVSPQGVDVELIDII